MSTIVEKAVCTSCGHIHGITAYPSINVSDTPELKEKVLNGEIFTWQCPDCGAMNLAKYPMVYHDPAERLLIVLSETPLNAEEVPEGYIARQVSNVGDFVEKIKIFDAGLDDVIMEVCKYVTANELGKQVQLKFFQIDGADHEITLTYPQNGQMEMISTGFNVYEDCAGIVNRNPVLRENAQGLARIDRDWVQRFFR